MQTCGPFLLIDTIASGGMGDVWLAAPRGLDGAGELCVLKRVKSELADNDVAVRRFIDEARLGLLLRHPCISRTIDAGRADGSDYLAAELVDGVDLAVLLGRLARTARMVDPLVAWWCVASALDGLAWAHVARHPLTGAPLHIVHRDVSPHNVMATRDGLVRVIDFGLALSSVRESQTQMGLVLGKLGYMAPEQARGDPVEARCDVYGAGVVLYELLAGERFYGTVPRDTQRLVAAAGLWRPAKARQVDDVTGGLFSAMVAPAAKDRPTAAEARDTLLARIADDDGTTEAIRRLGLLVTGVAAPELRRFDEARRRARDLSSTTIEMPPTTVSLALSESRAVQALLQAQAPPITREPLTVGLAPGQMWQPSPSLLAAADAAVARAMQASDTIAIATPPPPPTPPTPPTTPTTPTTPTPPASTSRTPIVVVASMALGLGMGILIGEPFRDADDGPPHATAAPPLPGRVGAPVSAPVPTAAMPSVTTTTTTTTPPTPTPTPTPAPDPIASTTVPAPPPAAAPPPVAAPPKTTMKTTTDLAGRIRRLARCAHPCGRTFVAPARDGVAGLNAAQRRAIEGMATNCERYCP